MFSRETVYFDGVKTLSYDDINLVGFVFQGRRMPVGPSAFAMLQPFSEYDDLSGLLAAAKEMTVSSDLWEGRRCIVLRFTAPALPLLRVKVWLTSQGVPVKIRYGAIGSDRVEWGVLRVVRLREYSGVTWPEVAVREGFSRDYGREPWCVSTMRTIELHPRELPSKDFFRTEFPNMTLVRDEIVGKSYIVGGEVPLAVYASEVVRRRKVHAQLFATPNVTAELERSEPSRRSAPPSKPSQPGIRTRKVVGLSLVAMLCVLVLYLTRRLRSAIGYVTPEAMREGRAEAIHAERDRKLAAARQARRQRNKQ